MYRARNTRNHRACIYLYEHLEGQEFIVFDTETTGLDPKTEWIVELAAQKYQIVEGKAQLIEEVDIFIRPPIKMSEDLIAIHGITNEFLETKQTEAELFPEIAKFFGPEPFILGYNVDFDVAMLQSMYDRNKALLRPYVVLDILEMVRDNLYGNDIENYKLGTIAGYLGVDGGLTFHQAIDDVKATYRVFDYCVNEYFDHKDVLTQKKEPLYANRISFWKGYNRKQSGVYVDTNVGRVYYSTFLKAWMSSKVELDKMDIDTFERDVLKKLELSNKELGKMTEPRFAKRKAFLRQKGVYL